MTPRMNYSEAAAETMKAMRAAEDATKELSIPLMLRELIKMRVSQINGCAYCLDMHAPAARDAGVSQQKLDVLAAWRESPAFDERECAALDWAEALTRIEQQGASEEVFQRLRNVFTERECVDLTFAVTLINSWNRFAIGFRSTHKIRERDHAAA
ncbi:carboxymuconolactone decarboxylase family protein [Thioclava sp.]|uniref:carboxymuconolactone decarboxylase family protein n=1 Tax=Thioclava sp. TaxID=1933450 RepID=UPI003242AA4F